MASRKVETETLGSSMYEARAKSAVVGEVTDLAGAKVSSEPSYEAIMQQIAYFIVCCSQSDQCKFG